MTYQVLYNPKAGDGSGKETAEKLGLTLAIHTPISVQAALSNHVDNNNDESEEDENVGNDEQEQE